MDVHTVASDSGGLAIFIRGAAPARRPHLVGEGARNSPRREAGEGRVQGFPRREAGEWRGARRAAGEGRRRARPPRDAGRRRAPRRQRGAGLAAEGGSKQGRGGASVKKGAASWRRSSCVASPEKAMHAAALVCRELRERATCAAPP